MRFDLRNFIGGDMDSRLGIAAPLSGLRLASLLALAATLAYSQATSTSSIAGLVTDEQGAAIAGAEVRIVDTSTGGAQTTLTNDSGRYVLVNIPPATYSISITKSGFAVNRITAQKV